MTNERLMYAIRESETLMSFVFPLRRRDNVSRLPCREEAERIARHFTRDKVAVSKLSRRVLRLAERMRETYLASGMSRAWFADRIAFRVTVTL